MTAAAAKPQFSLGRFIVYAVLAFAVLFYGAPLLWLFVAATRSQGSLYSDSPYAIGNWTSLTTTWSHLSNYNNFELVNWAVNSAIYAIGGVLLSLISAIPAGYVLALYDFRGRKLVLVLTLIAIITPSSAIVLPIFLEMTLIGLNNSYAGLILATGFFPFGVYLAYIYYSSSMPAGIMDSGLIDGCNRFQLFYYMGLPLAGPLIALVAFFSFLANWSNYFLAFVLLSDDRLYSLPVGLTALISSTGALNNQQASEIPIKMPEAIQACILVVAPVLLIFLVAQRFVRAGLLSGAEKG
ncbi:MAG: carbohydrate ABC transporter permease [Devosia sp.]|nr:carbohydrate ABC transporter permease [Devosia sp.]